MPNKNSEMRKEVRIPMEGSVRIVPAGAAPGEFLGRLMDTSDNGFRACYTHPALSNGQTVHFQHDAAAGTARVIWNRILSGAVETGFVIVKPAKHTKRR